MTTALIARLEALTGPSREMDFDIFEAALGRGFRPSATHAYTSSLDAALTLVPEGKFFHMARFSDEAMGCDVHIYSADAPTFETIGQAPTLPLALCIAALKAREASKP